ncbi:MAG TPA: hypothetical protein VF070_14530 [Streptosporangiaceae bacterium]
MVLAGLALIAGQLGWTAFVLSRSYFRQSDFLMLDRALREGLGWKYLTWVDAGHLMPAGLAVTWAVARTSVYSWPLAATAIMILVAAAALAMLRMLVTVFGRFDGASSGRRAGARFDGASGAASVRAGPVLRGAVPPGILIPLAVYLFAPLSVGAVAWLSVAVRVLPLQLAMFMAVHAHVRYLREERTRHLIASAVWLVVGMASADQGVLVPLLLFALTVGYFGTGRLREAASQAVVRYRRAWVTYALLLAGYCAVFFVQLVAWGVHVAGPGRATSLYEFAGNMLGAGFVPGLLGGPWQWAASGYAQAAPPAAAEYLSWIVVAVVVVVSCVYRPSAWRAWAILLGWVVAACIVPAAIGGAGFGLSVTALAEQTGYLANATGVLALCLGLAFLPAGVTADAPVRSARVLATLAFCCFFCFVAGTVASLQNFESVTSAAVARSYVATARRAVADAPRGTVIIDAPTPVTVMAPGFFSGEADTRHVIGPLARKGSRVTDGPSWVSTLDGVYSGQMIFDAKGQLRPVTVTGLASQPPPKPKPSAARRSYAKGGKAQPPGSPGSAGSAQPAGSARAAARACWNVTGAGMNIPLKGTLYRWAWTARVAYSGPAGLLSVTFGGSGSQRVAIPAGDHVVYVPVTGSGNAINLRFVDPAGSNADQAGTAGTAGTAGPLCVSGVTVGLIDADQKGRAIPAAPVPG